ncbi:hypothetical protein [Bradyrhizobium sp. CCGB01]|uniref:hypothetical protein n=1 Tax=Bradyrhizobium sp. CCGB01 TaxID=2949634 RepID=UPI0020B28067|nr:hypothetical protein [Bradyrhizobium sp. CCGB01]MCP3406212.1 hypothetical protein [Bradyrhizobium sp. CCGB01]
MIAVPGYEAEFAVRDDLGKRTWRACDVVGVRGEPFTMQFVIVVRGPVEYVDVVNEVRRRLPSTEPFS